MWVFLRFMFCNRWLHMSLNLSCEDACGLLQDRGRDRDLLLEQDTLSTDAVSLDLNHASCAMQVV